MAAVESYAQLHVLFVINLLVFFPGRMVQSSAGSIVKSLPGFEGPLPFCLETGYVEVDNDQDKDGQLFYYFIKSERNPEQDPLLLWLAGGPRCSGLSAIVYEIGPISFKEGYLKENNNDIAATYHDVPALELNPFSWTQVANIVFLDAPIGAGFSYSKSGRESNISDTKSVHQTYQFLQKWFVDHPEFLSNPFYICGDSYSGIIIPIIVQTVINDIEAGKGPIINFKGYCLGNPATGDWESNERVPYAHMMGIIPTELYESLKQNCRGNYINVDPSNAKCLTELQVFSKCFSSLNPSNILEPVCLDENQVFTHNRRSTASVRQTSRTFSCRSEAYSLLEEWANDDRVQTSLHARKGTLPLGKWVRCNLHDVPGKPDYGMPYDHDATDIVSYHQNISNKGYKSLIYSGDHDMVVPHISTESWIRSLRSSITGGWGPWFVDGQVAGYITTFSNGMKYATVKGAGHTAPEYKPAETFALFKMWMYHSI